MLENLEQLLSVLRRVTLTSRERQNIRIRLEAHMREHPIRQSMSQRVYAHISQALQSLERSFNSPRFFTHPAFATFVLVLCVSAGTSYAAQGALPGEPLYSFKTHINERIEGSFAFSPAAKAQWNAELASRRLMEAEELVVTGELTPVARAEIETGINFAVQKFNSNLTLLSAKDEVQVANVQSELEATFNAHETVLNMLPTKSVTSKDNTANLASLVRQHAEQIGKDRSLVEATLTATDSPAVKTAALNQKKSAEKAIKRAKTFSTTIVDTRVASSVVSIATAAENDVQAGDKDVENGRWGKAYGAFQDAIRKVKETQDTVDTRRWLRTKFGVSFDASATTTAATTTDQQLSTTTQTDDDSTDKKSDEDTSDESDDNRHDNDRDRKRNQDRDDWSH